MIDRAYCSTYPFHSERLFHFSSVVVMSSPPSSPSQPGELTAGRAKNATPIMLKVAASRRPFQVLGTLSP